MKQITAILSLVLAQRRNQGRASLFFVPTLLFLVAVVFSSLALILAGSKMPLEYALTPLGAAGAVLIIYWWALYLSTAWSLCSPSALQFTPRLRVSIMLVTVLMWLGLSLFMLSFFVHATIFCMLVWALAGSVLFDAQRITRCLVLVAGFWIICSTGAALFMPEIIANYFATSHLAVVILVWAAAASILGWVGISSMFLTVNLLLLCIFIASVFVPRVQVFLLSYLRVVDFVAWTLLFFLFAIGSITVMLFKISRTRGASLAAAHRTQIYWREYNARAGNPASRAGSAADTGKWLGYTRSLNRDLSKNNTGTRLIGYLFGPGFFWTWHVSLAIIACAFVLLFRVFFIDPTKAVANATLIGFIFPAIIFSAWMVLPNLIFRVRKEQSLLSLTPKWPNRTELNHWLGRAIVFRSLGIWLTCLIVLAAFVLVYQIPVGAFFVPALSSLVIALIACGYAMMDYAHTEKPLPRERRLAICAMIITYASLFLVVIFNGPVSLVVLGFATISLLGAVVRWRRLIGGAAALPAGRLVR